MELKFRDLKAEEIDCRVATINEKGLTLLLYKDARCDMNILDETVGRTGWQRDHKELKGNIYCGISIYDTDQKEWITKWDCGKESFSDAEKGEASDSFKRAGFNWGIGRSLYSAPFIYIPAEKVKMTQSNGKYKTYDTYIVEAITYDEKGNIDKLSIKNNRGERVFLKK